MNLLRTKGHVGKEAIHGRLKPLPVSDTPLLTPPPRKTYNPALASTQMLSVIAIVTQHNTLLNTCRVNYVLK